MIEPHTMTDNTRTFIEKMQEEARAKYPNLHTYHEAHWSEPDEKGESTAVPRHGQAVDLDSLISQVVQNTCEEIHNKAEVEKPDLSEYDGRDMRFWQGYRKGIAAVQSLINDITSHPKEE